ncbi:unnamed protein product [Rotaria magnacalcarata]|uniref:Uncharacterized protein n=1 Tax=Rotaria magnacalcarata TaxID=392030 RepID=A0A815FK80_9BILA|nr:unnamed protein product [Rotaria magnacalcarata]CAF1561967.1 unnamed protein product [Rotaria magnacalcarata]CAF2057773.1 unnamed protein product [Rotaria magnacalcarata]CAF2134843.1 unnamed protein product [Rotaria magnacalcarata]CAF3846933.1 unnamed protein product [Rotaria magnacalcarata]
MYVVKPKAVAYLNDNRIYHSNKKFYRNYDGAYFPKHTPHTYDLRLIILRHGERIDTTLGENWFEQVFGDGKSPPQSHLRSYLPSRLPNRRETALYMLDPPITRNGQQKALMLGNQLSRSVTNIDACYSSPAARCVLTAASVLQGMNRTNIPLRLETYLFEPMIYNKPYQEFITLSPFMSPHTWARAGYNMDRTYQRLDDFLAPQETETDYRDRSQYFLETIEQEYDRRVGARGYSRPSTVLIVGHAATPLIFSNIASRQQLDPVAFGQQCAHIPFLHTMVLERNAATHKWKAR